MKTLISNFSKGEFGPQLYARTDVPQYNAGAKQLKNFVVQRYGGARFRPGFRFAGEVDDASQSYRLIPFLFSANQAYVQLMGPLQLRLLAQGGFVVEDNLKIISATREAQMVLEIPYHAMSVGDRFYLDGIVGMVEANGRFAKVLAVVDASHVRVNIDSSNFSLFVSSDGIVRSGAPAAPATPPAPLPDPTITDNTPPSTGTGSDENLQDPWWYRTGGLTPRKVIP